MAVESKFIENVRQMSIHMNMVLETASPKNCPLNEIETAIIFREITVLAPMLDVWLARLDREKRRCIFCGEPGHADCSEEIHRIESVLGHDIPDVTRTKARIALAEFRS